MTTPISVTNKNFNTCPLSIPYTGTKEQPDLVTIFYKNDLNQVTFEHENIHATLNYNPLDFHNAIFRVHTAVIKIFHCLQGKDGDLWNATKNLTRGCVALLPLVGNAALYLYDRIKTKFYFDKKIENSLSSQIGPILGIAFDGKIITTFSIDQLSKALNGTPDNSLAVLAYLWTSLLVKSQELSSPNFTRESMVNNLDKFIGKK